jgi:uncharacterized protein
VALITFLVIGIAAGVLSGLFGIGGGVLIVPALVLLARLPQATATGTSLGALMLPVGAFVGALAYHRAGNLNVKAAIVIAIGMSLGAFLGAKLALGMSEVLLRRLFAGFLALMAMRMWFSA